VIFAAFKNRVPQSSDANLPSSSFRLRFPFPRLYKNNVHGVRRVYAGRPSDQIRASHDLVVSGLSKGVVTPGGVLRSRTCPGLHIFHPRWGFSLRRCRHAGAERSFCHPVHLACRAVVLTQAGSSCQKAFRVVHVFRGK
jgi:hypothetical protein